MLFRVNAEYAQITEIIDGLYICGVTSLNAENMEKYNISLIINATTEIEEVVSQGGKVLVHCVAGVSRSASLCLAFLVKYRNMSLRDAYRHMASRRPLVRPNIGFWRQLISFEQKLFDEKTFFFRKCDEQKDQLNLLFWVVNLFLTFTFLLRTLRKLEIGRRTLTFRIRISLCRRWSRYPSFLRQPLSRHCSMRHVQYLYITFTNSSPTCSCEVIYFLLNVSSTLGPIDYDL
uniref:Dual specificity protein phosphatase 14 n=1 Tax=Ascaris lumbricoides TaxID=6252 RepID=A0A0M3HVJ6_ASCLU